MTKRISIGVAAHIRVNGRGRCGGAVVRGLKKLLAVWSPSMSFARTKMKKNKERKTDKL
jgi:hypothetical protein